MKQTRMTLMRSTSCLTPHQANTHYVVEGYFLSDPPPSKHHYVDEDYFLSDPPPSKHALR